VTRVLLNIGVAVLATGSIFAADGRATDRAGGRESSGRIGYYGIVEKVVLEPNETAPDRIQVWGAFAYVDGSSAATSPVKRGYLYFKVRSDIPGFTSQAEVDVTRREWTDLKAVAGTGQAIGFGSWGYIGRFDVLEPGGVAGPPSYLYERKPQGGERTDLRVRPGSEAPTAPATYQTDTGIVKLSESGSHAAIVKQLKAALRSPD
jgi:hypothetical protein